MSITLPPGTHAAAAPSHGFRPAQRLALASLLAALSLLIMLTGLALRSSLKAGQAGDQALQSQRAGADLAGLQSVLTDAELPDGPARLSALKQQADAHLAALRTLLAPDAEQYSRLVALGPLLSARFDALALPADPRARAAVPAGDAARQQQLRIRSALAELHAAALAHSAAQQQRANSGQAWATGLMMAACVAALAMLVAGWLVLQHQGRRLAGALALHDSDSQRAQRATRALQTLLDMAPDAICHVDGEGRVSRANTSCIGLWARPASALAGMPLVELIAPDDQRRTAQMLAAVSPPATVPVSWAARCKRPDGSLLPMAWTASATGADADAGVWCIAQDRSPQVDAAAQLAARDAALGDPQTRAAEADARADAADGVKAALLASTGPALRAPVDAILGLAGMLQKGLSGPLGAGQQRQVAQLRRHAQQLLRTVNHLLDITRLEAGTLPVAHEAFDLLESVQTVASAARVQAIDKGLKFDVELAPELGYARGDAARVEQILHNLLDNAVRATTAGSIRLQAAAQPDGTLRISVQDSGAGMDAATVARLFRPFGPAGGSDGKAGEESGTGTGTSMSAGIGIGLGLALSQGLARRMGGSIGASSAPGQGSTFVLTLPADLVAQQ